MSSKKKRFAGRLAKYVIFDSGSCAFAKRADRRAINKVRNRGPLDVEPIAALLNETACVDLGEVDGAEGRSDACQRTGLISFYVCIAVRGSASEQLNCARSQPTTTRNRPKHRKMSKRHRPNSPPTPPTKATRLTQATKPFVCELPPTCSKHPTTLGSPSELESHYSTCHAHVCSAEGCNRIFPEPRFLDLVRSSSDIFALSHKLLTFTSTKQNVTIPLQK